MKRLLPFTLAILWASPAAQAAPRQLWSGAAKTGVLPIQWRGAGEGAGAGGRLAQAAAEEEVEEARAAPATQQHAAQACQSDDDCGPGTYCDGGRCQEVRFPSVARTVDQGYSSVTSESFRSGLGEALGSSVRLGAAVEAVLPDEVRLEDGTRVAAGAVIDGRGDIDRGHLELGFQKFVGRTLALEGGHGLRGPILMDATVPQEDGFRFLYTLPVGDRRVNFS